MSTTLTIATLAPVAARMKELGLSKEDITRETGYALQIVNSNAKLKTCSPNSVLSAIVYAASTGLTLNPAVQHACLIPRWSREETVCEFQPMYRGLMFLAIKEGAATKFNVQAVHVNDTFKATPDNDQQPVHHEFTGFNRGVIHGYYSVATMLDGTKVAEFMSVEDIREVRACSDGYKYAVKNDKTHPWISNEPEMSKKTIIKRHVKRLPSGKADSKLYAAVEIDNADYIIETVETPKVIKEAQQKETLSPKHKSWEKAIGYVGTGTTRQEIEKKYDISEADWKELAKAGTAHKLTIELSRTA
jgi:phage RecT family recombinase